MFPTGRDWVKTELFLKYSSTLQLRETSLKVAEFKKKQQPQHYARIQRQVYRLQNPV